MENKFEAKASVDINAPASKVWEALTTPSIISLYLFGTNVTSDWQVGSAITYAGEFNDKAYEDKGIILTLEPEKVFESTYWSSMSGLEDKPENYNKVGYHLESKGNKTIVTVTQDNIATEEQKNHSAQNWKMVLDKLKEILETDR